MRLSEGRLAPRKQPRPFKTTSSTNAVVLLPQLSSAVAVTVNFALSGAAEQLGKVQPCS